jgi:hypothetical protein
MEEVVSKIRGLTQERCGPGSYEDQDVILCSPVTAKLDRVNSTPGMCAVRSGVPVDLVLWPLHLVSSCEWKTEIQKRDDYGLG